MADSKYSGLPAVAAFAATQEWAVNDSGTSRKISGAQLIAAVAQGTLSGGYAQITANSATFTTIVDIAGLAITVTPLAGRRIRLSAWCAISSSVNTDAIQVALFEGATQLTNGIQFMHASVGTGYIYLSVILQPTAAAHTYKVSAARQTGTGNCLIQASTTQVAYLLAEDIGV